MGLFDELKKKAQDLTYTATEKAQELAAVATEKGREAADSAKASVTILNEKRSIEKNLRAIGEWYLSTLDGEVPPAVADVVAAVRASQAKIAELEAQREKEAPADPAPEAPADPAPEAPAPEAPAEEPKEE